MCYKYAANVTLTFVLAVCVSSIALRAKHTDRRGQATVRRATIVLMDATIIVNG